MSARISTAARVLLALSLSVLVMAWLAQAVQTILVALIVALSCSIVMVVLWSFGPPND